MTIANYVLRVIERDLALPSRREWFDRVHALEPVEGVDAAALIREGRREREEQLDRTLRR